MSLAGYLKALKDKGIIERIGTARNATGRLSKHSTNNNIPRHQIFLRNATVVLILAII
jgi:Trm5-related predicted tRNA methylase